MFSYSHMFLEMKLELCFYDLFFLLFSILFFSFLEYEIYLNGTDEALCALIV